MHCSGCVVFHQISPLLVLFCRRLFFKGFFNVVSLFVATNIDHLGQKILYYNANFYLMLMLMLRFN